MSLGNFLKPIIPNFPQVTPDSEIDVLQELPIETLYLALKDADNEVTQWFMENALPAQVQGLIDIDCWAGSEFLPERGAIFFREITQLHPIKIREYMKDLDPEYIVRILLEFCQVLDYDHSEPLDFPEKSFLLTPDNKYVLFLKTEAPDIREMLYQWLNKFSAGNLDLMRRHLESCKWEQISDLEEFSYQIKKGRIEDMGFVDYHEAISLYAHGNARKLKEELIQNPISKSTKMRAHSMKEGLEEGSEEVNPFSPEEWLPQVIAEPIFSDGFLAKALAEVKDPQTREILLQEILRTLNAGLAADGALHGDLDTIGKNTKRGRLYMDLGLSYLSQGQAEQGANWLETQPLMQVYRLGWLVVQDLQTAARQLIATTPVSFFGSPDQEILQSLMSRHPELDDLYLKDLEMSSKDLLTLGGIVKIGERLAQLGWLQKFFLGDLKTIMDFEKRPLLPNESAYARLATALFRQNTSPDANNISSAPLSIEDWATRSPKFNKDSFSKALNLVVEQAPEASRALVKNRFDSLADDLDYFCKNSPTKIPDLRYFKSLVFDLGEGKNPKEKN